MANESIDKNRLLLLRQKILDKSATKAENGEYMKLMYQNGSITKEQYDSYFKKPDDELLRFALTLGAAVLFSFLLGKLFEE